MKKLSETIIITQDCGCIITLDIPHSESFTDKSHCRFHDRLTPAQAEYWEALKRNSQGLSRSSRMLEELQGREGSGEGEKKSSQANGLE